MKEKIKTQCGVVLHIAFDLVWAEYPGYRSKYTIFWQRIQSLSFLPLFLPPLFFFFFSIMKSPKEFKQYETKTLWPFFNIKKTHLHD